MADEIDDLDKRFEEAVEQPITRLASDQDKTRKMVWVVVGSLVFDLVYSAVLGFVALSAASTADKANEAALVAQVAALEAKLATERANEATRRAAFTSCESGNDFRELDLQRWLYVLKIASQPDPDETPAQRQRTLEQNAKFKSYIVRADKLRDCEALVANQVK